MTEARNSVGAATLQWHYGDLSSIMIHEAPLLDWKLIVPNLLESSWTPRRRRTQMTVNAPKFGHCRSDDKYKAIPTLWHAESPEPFALCLVSPNRNKHYQQSRAQTMSCSRAYHQSST